MNHPREYRDKEVVVLGLARSGVAVAKLFHQLGAKVVVNDKKERHLCPEADELEALGISVVCGGHPDGLVHSGVALLVKNPGIPYTIGPLVKAASLGLEIVTEVEVAYHLCPAPIIGITGSNGKTTTTIWIGRMLEAQGLRPIVAGNIGVPLCEAVQDADKDNRMVIELSSFQLKGTSAFRPHIACLLNVYETHLDYHGSLDDYVSSKARLFANQTPEDIAVLNWDNETCRRLAPQIRSEIVWFSAQDELDCGVFVERSDANSGSHVDPLIVHRDRTGQRHVILPVSRLGIPGSFNVENALAATAAALSCGAEPSVIARVLEEFHGVEHRLEFVAEVGGVAYYNNSKATNATATAKALEAFSQPVVLIAGGLDRGLAFDELIPFFGRQVKALVTLGETKEKIKQAAEEAGLTRVISVDTAKDAAQTLVQAVRQARGFAEPGDVVLLSPACASWDMFSSYEERGRIFKESVHNL